MLYCHFYVLKVHSHHQWITHFQCIFFSKSGIRWMAAAVTLRSQIWANNWVASALWGTDKWFKDIPLIWQITCQLNSLWFALSFFPLGVKLNPHLFASEDVLGQFDLGEVAFADGFQEPVAADVWLLVCCGVGHVAALWIGVRLQRERGKKIV